MWCVIQEQNNTQIYICVYSIQSYIYTYIFPYLYLYIYIYFLCVLILNGFKIRICPFSPLFPERNDQTEQEERREIKQRLNRKVHDAV